MLSQSNIKRKSKRRIKETLFSLQCFCSNLLTAMEMLLGPGGFLSERDWKEKEKKQQKKNNKWNKVKY